MCRPNQWCVHMYVCYCKHDFPASLLLGHTGWRGAQTNQLPFSWILKGISARLGPWDPAATLSSVRSGAKSIRSRHIISEAHNRKLCPWSEPIFRLKRCAVIILSSLFYATSSFQNRLNYIVHLAKPSQANGGHHLPTVAKH